MRQGGGEGYAWQPAGAPPLLLNVQQSSREDDHWRQFDNSVNAVSFGFVATAILISMFLIMAIFERFLRPNSQANGRRHNGDLESEMGLNAKLGHSSPKMTLYANGVSVLMPGDNIPTFIGRPAPVRCPPTRISLPYHGEPLPNSSPNRDSNSSSAQDNA